MIYAYKIDNMRGVFNPEHQVQALSNIHDHLTSWKVDFDIVGTSNSFHRTVLLAGNYDDIFGPGSIPSYASEDHVVKYATDTLVETEAGYKLKFEVSNTKDRNTPLVTF